MVKKYDEPLLTLRDELLFQGVGIFKINCYDFAAHLSYDKIFRTK